MWKLVLFLMVRFTIFFHCLFFSFIMCSLQDYFLNVAFQGAQLFCCLFSNWDASIQNIPVCAPYTFPHACVQKWGLFYGEIYRLSFFIICSSEQNVNYTLSAVPGAHFFFLFSKGNMATGKTRFSQYTSFFLKVVTRSTHLASALANALAWRLRAGVEVCAKMWSL